MIQRIWKWPWWPSTIVLLCSSGPRFQKKSRDTESFAPRTSKNSPGKRFEEAKIAPSRLHVPDSTAFSLWELERLGYLNWMMSVVWCSCVCFFWLRRFRCIIPFELMYYLNSVLASPSLFDHQLKHSYDLGFFSIAAMDVPSNPASVYCRPRPDFDSKTKFDTPNQCWSTTELVDSCVQVLGVPPSTSWYHCFRGNGDENRTRTGFWNWLHKASVHQLLMALSSEIPSPPIVSLHLVHPHTSTLVPLAYDSTWSEILAAQALPNHIGLLHLEVQLCPIHIFDPRPWPVQTSQYGVAE